MESLGKHLSEEEIAMAVENLQFPDKESLPIEIALHIEDCVDCKLLVLENYENMREIEKAQSSENNLFIQETFTNNRLIMKVAAALILLVISSILVYFFILKEKEMSPENKSNLIVQPKPSDTLKNKIDTSRNDVEVKQQIALNSNTGTKESFVPAPNLESIVKSNVRSGGNLVQSPVNECTVKLNQNVLFTFKMDKAENLNLKILNNKEKTVFTTQLS